MTVAELPVPSLLRRTGTALAFTMNFVLGVAGARAPATLKILQEHIWTIVGLGLFDSAMFVHSLFTGLLVTGLSFFVFEWKISNDEGGNE